VTAQVIPLPPKPDTLLDVVADYADRLAQSDTLADTGSMAAAKALAELYERREWVDEWLEQKPILEKKAYIGGRPPEPDSRNRFTQWLAWKEEQRQRRAIRSSQAYGLFAAWEVRQVLSTTAEITSERVVRPLNWMRKNRYADRIPEVWARAVELAGSTKAVTSAHTRQALADWKRDVLGAKGVRSAIRSAKAERDRARAVAYVRALWADGDDAEAGKFDDWYKKFRKGEAV
jgi:hypothetical protein